MQKFTNGVPMDGGNGDEPLSNPSTAPHFQEVLAARISRRSLLQGGLAAALGGLFGGSAAFAAMSEGESPTTITPDRVTLLGFSPIPVSREDTVHVPPGYRTQVLAEWGRSLSNPERLYALPLTAAEQADAIGSHHDGMHFFPIEGSDPHHGSSHSGLLVINHEYVEPRYMHASAVGQPLNRNAFPTVTGEGGHLHRHSAEVLTEMAGHGVSVMRIERDPAGRWVVVSDPRNRRITATTPMEIAGPVRGSDRVKTRYSPDGTRTRGTLNNCAHGVTPWNTYLTCEENWAGYFRNRAQSGDDQPREHRRYGVRAGVSRYGWELAAGDPNHNHHLYARFNAVASEARPEQDFRNEPNGFGWVVEIDPFRPESTPVKRTHLGRFAHEGVIFQPAVEGKPLVCYSGDDARNEYIYKFVSAQPYLRESAGGHLLDSGTLYVAKFTDDGSGEWLPLVWGQGPLQPQPLNQGEERDGHCFLDQADVLVNTRLAADLLGATPMDRPEWGAVDSATGQVYFTLTNNTSRTQDAVTAANPRANNRWGQIIRWQEAGGDPAATRFHWDLFILAGPSDDSRFQGQPLDASQIFNSPDGLWFDPDGRLWIQTDMSESVVNTGDWAQFGNNQMLACDPQHGDLRRFFTGCLGQETTGVVTTPDQRTMFVNQQHPGATISAEAFASGQLAGLGNWPLGGNHYGRSATVVITKEDGGVVGG